MSACFRAKTPPIYLHRGARVIAIDADPGAIHAAQKRFADAVATGRLHLIHGAVGRDSGTVTFHLSSTPEWNSLTPAIAERNAQPSTAITVPVVRLRDVFRTHGNPDYCKIDVEGADRDVVESLEGAELPRFLSVETECAGDVRLTDEDAALTLDALIRVGYR